MGKEGCGESLKVALHHSFILALFPCFNGGSFPCLAVPSGTFREYSYAAPWFFQQAAMWESASLSSFPWAIGKHLLVRQKAVEVIKYKIPENIPECAPLLAATIGVVDTLKVSRLS